MQIKNKVLAADISLVFVALLWGGGFIATKYALETVGPNYINLLRFSIAFIIMTVVFHKKLTLINKRVVASGFVIGLFLYIGFVLQTVGLQYTTASKQAFLTGTNVVMVPFLYWIARNKKPDKYNVFAAIIALLGIGFLSLNETFTINIGDSLSLISAVFFAAHIVAIACFARTYDPILLTIIQFGTVVVLSLISSMIFEAPPSFTTKSTLGIVYLGVFSTLICFALQNVAQKYTPPAHAAVILCLEAVFGSVLSCIILGEAFTFKMIIGSIAVFLAIVTAETKWGFLKKKKV